MANPLLEAMSGIGNGQAGQISRRAKAFKRAKDPSKLVESNPQLKTILERYNGDAKKAFYSLCKQRGINPETILSQLE